MKVDILIKNGLVIDPYQNKKEVRTIAVKEDKIVDAVLAT